jgi:hypothetical protein
MINEDNIGDIKAIILKERGIAGEINSLFAYLKRADAEETKLANDQIEQLKSSLKNVNDRLLNALDSKAVQKSVEEKKDAQKTKESLGGMKEKEEQEFRNRTRTSVLDKEIIKRLKKGEEKESKKKIEQKSGDYAKFANSIFGNLVRSWIKQKKLTALEKDLIKSNLKYTSISYISSLILTIIISLIGAVLLTVFFLFFNVGPDLPIITRVTEQLDVRLLKIFWLIFVVPIVTGVFMYFYPSIEKNVLEGRIDSELPFATIHMAAISGSLIEPVKVFSIVSSTKEYPNLEKEFNKLLNEINVYGYDIVTALKNLALNCPSSKLAELFNGLATTITSGGDLYDFFEKRSQTLLFEYRLDKEKRTKAAETFMDIYISVVIAAPMILMLLLMMMKVSGMGVGLSTGMITFLVVGGISVINIFFLIFLQLKSPETA